MRRLRLRNLFALSLAALAVPAITFAQASVSVTGPTPINQCEANGYTITVSNPAGATTDVEAIVITNTMPPTGFVYLAGSTTITSPSGVDNTDPGVVGQVLTWDIDAIYGSAVVLTPGDDLTIDFTMETDCTAVGGTDQLSVAYTGTGSPRSDNFFITVKPGDISVYKTPANQPASIGDAVTWTLKVRSTGLGDIQNVRLTDTLGTGMSWASLTPAPAEPAPYPSTVTWSSTEIPALATMAVDDEVTITAVANVDACTDLTNDFDASFGCIGLGQIPDQTCVNTATESPPGTAAAAIDYVLKPPDISVTIGSMENIPYCSNKTVSVTVTNGDPVTPDPDVGGAYSFVLDLDGLPSGYEITNVTGGVSYNPATGEFTIGDIAANSETSYTFDINWQTGACPPSGGGVTLWQSIYDDECGNPFAPPVQIKSVSLTDLPSLSITKNDPGIVNGNDTITFTVQVSYEGTDGFTPTITDDYPNPTPGWTIQNITGGGVDDGDKITWTPTLNGGDTWSESFEMTLSDPCTGPPEALYTNTAAVTGGTDCRGCTISGDSQSVTFAFEDTPGCDGDCNVDGVRSGGGTAEVCTNISYTNTYSLSGSARPTSWSGSTMTDDMVLGQTYVSLDAVTVDGTDYTSFVSDNGGAGGNFEVDLSGLDSAPGCPAPDAASTLVIEYTFQAGNTTGSQYSQSVMMLSGCSSEMNWILVNVERTNLNLALSGPSLTERCGIETYTMSLTKNGYDVYDLLVIFDLDPDGDLTNNYEYVANTTVFTGTFTESGGGAITAFEPDTGTPGKLRWDFATQGGGSGDLSAVGSIEIDLRMPCSAGHYTYAAEARYNDRCDNGSVPRESTVTAGPDQPMYIAEANAFVMKGPEQNYADQTPVTWTLTVTNGGDGAAYNLVVTDTLDADLSYNSSSVTPASVVPAPPAGGNVIVWDFASLVAPLDDLEDLDGDGQYDDLTPGGQVSFTITADIIGCDNLDNEVYGEWGCLSGTCQTSATDYSEVLLPPDGLVGVATFPGTIALCGTGDIVIEVKNSGQTNLYNLYVWEEFPRLNPPSGAFYQAGSAEYRHYDSSTSTWSGWTAISDPSGSGTAGDPYVWDASHGITEFNDLPIEDIVEIRYEILTDCDFVTSDRTFRTTAGYDSVCDEAQVTDETQAILLIQDMNVSVLKEGRIGTSGAFQEAELYAVNGDTVEWRVTLNSTGAADAQNASLSDQYPADVDYVSTVSGTPPDSVSGGPGGETLTWNASTVMSNDGGVDPNLLDGTFQVTLRGTVIGCTSPSCNTATAEWGCNAGGTCVSGSNADSQCLVLQPDISTTTNDLTGFTTCNGTITFTVTNDGARAEALDMTYALPSGYLYDSSAGGAEITSSDPAHTFTEAEEVPVDLGGSPQQIEFASVANGGNINNGNDYVDPGETLTVTFNVYRDPSSGQCDSDPSSDPPPPPNATGTASGTYEDTCGGGPNAIAFTPDTETVAYPDLDITVIPSTQVVPDGSTATFNVTLRNNGTSTADNWTATHTLGAGYSSINSTLGSVVGQQVIFVYTDAGGGAILPSTQRTYTITADVGTGSLVHDYQVVGPCQDAGGSVTGCDYSYDGDSVYSANFDDAKTPDTQTATIGETITFTVTGEFQNPTYSNVVITDTLPTPGLQYISYTIVSGPAPSFTEPSPGVLRFDYGTISAPTTIQIDIDARVDDDAVNFAGATQTNDVNFSFDYEGQSYSENDDADVEIIEPDIQNPQKASTLGPDPFQVQAGFTVPFTLEFTNNGTSPAYNTIVVDTLPPEMRDTDPTTLAYSITIDDDPVTPPNPLRTLTPGVDYTVAWNGTTGELTFTFVTPATASAARVDVGETATISFNAVVDWDVSGGVSFQNGFTATSYDSLPTDAGNPDIRNYSDGSDTYDLYTDEVEIEKSIVSGSPAAIGETVTYLLTVTIPAETTAYWPDVRDAIDTNGLEYVAMSTVLADVSGDPVTAASFVIPPGEPTEDYTPDPGATLTWDLNTIDNADPASPQGDTAYVFTIEFDVLVTGLDDGGLPNVWSPPAAGDDSDDRGKIRWDWTSSPTEPSWDDLDDEDDSPDVTTDVDQPVLSSFNKTTSTANPVQGGQQVDYTVTFTNSGWNTAFDTVVTDLIPLGMRNATPAVDSITIGARTLSTPMDYTTAWDGSTFTISFVSSDTSLPVSTNTSASRIEVGETVTINYHTTVDADVGTSWTMTDEARVTGYTGLPGASSDERSYSGIGPDDVTHNTDDASVAKATNPPTVTIGEPLTYTLTIDVPTATTAYNLALADTVEDGLTVTNVTSAPSGTPAWVEQADGTTDVTVTFGDVLGAAGVDRTVTIYAYVDQSYDGGTCVVRGDSFQDQGSIGWDDRDTGGSHYTDTSNQVTNTVVEPTLEIDKEAAPTTGDAGDTITMTITVNHTAPSNATAYDTEITDVIPAGMTYADNVVSINGPAPTVDASGDPTILFSWASIGTTYNAGNPVQFSFDVTLDDTVEPNEVITNDADLEWTSLSGSDPNERTGSGVGCNTYNDSDDDDVTINDVSLAKTLLGDGTAVIGETFQYRTVIDLIEGTMNNVTLTDTLDAGLAFVSQDGFAYDPSITISGSTDPVVGTGGESLTWNLGQIVNPAGPAADTITITYTVCVTNVTANQNGQTRNNAVELTYDGGGPLSDAAADTTIEEPDLVIDKEAAPTTGDAGDTITMTITVNHTASSTAAAQDVEITDVIPASMTYADNVVSINGPAPVVDASGDPTILFSWGSIGTTYNAGNPVQFSFDVTLDDTVEPNEVITNDADLEWTSISGDPGQVSPYNSDAYERTGDPSNPGEENDYNDIDDADVTVDDNTALSKTLLGDGTAVIGETFQYRTVIDLIEGTLNNVTLTDTIDPGLAFVSQDGFAYDPSITISGSTDPVVGTGGESLTWNLGQIVNPAGPAADTITITYTVCVTNVTANQNGQTRNNAVELTYDGGGPLSDAAADTTIEEPDLVIDKEAAPTTGDAGDTITMTITVNHTASSTAAAQDVEITDVIPAGMTYADNVVSINGPAPVVDASGDPTILFSWGSIGTAYNAGNPVQFSFDVTLDDTVEPNEVITNDADLEWTSISGDPGQVSPYNSDAYERTGDPSDPGEDNDYNDSDDDDVTVGDISLAKTLMGDGDAAIGETFQYEVVVTLIEGTVENATLTDTLDPGLAFVSQDSFVYDPSITISGSTDPVVGTGGESLTWNLGQIVNPAGPAPDTITITYTVVVLNVVGNQGGSPGTLLNNAVQLTYDGGGPLSDSAADTEVIEPVLEIAKVPDVTVVDVGDVVIYTITIQHGASSQMPAYDLVVSDTVPSEYDITPVMSDGLDNDGDTFIDAADLDGEGTVAGQDVTFIFGNTGVARFQTLDIGQTISLLLRCVVNSSAATAEELINTARVDWTSRTGDPGQVSPYNTDSTERTGADGPGGALNDYAVEDSAVPVTLTRPDMRLEKDDGQTYVSPTHILTYTITFWNDGNIVTDPSTQIVDAIPADTTYVAGGTACSLAATIEYSVGGAPYSATEPPTDTANVTIRWSLPSGVPATSGPHTATFQVQVDDGLDNGDTVTNEATISDGGTHGIDPTPWNNTDDDVDQVQVPELSILKDDGVTLVEAGEMLTYVLTYANNGDADAPNTVIEDAIPAGTTYVAGGTSIIDPTAQIWYSVGGAPYDTTEPTTGTADVTIQFRVPNLVASDGGTAQFQVQVDMPLTVSTIINTSTIDYDGSNGSDPEPWNNSDTDTDYGKLPLFVMKRCAGWVSGYDTPNPGDWTYWDAEARNPSGLAGDWWVIPDDPWVIRKMTEVDSGDGGSQEFAILKLEGGDFSDYNIYLYNIPVIGDLTYWDAMARNPSPLARDLWQIPGGNDTALLADGGNAHMLSMKDEGGDFNIYLYNSLYPGDWSYWDAVARNPSPLARDLWVISGGNDIVAMCGLDTTGDMDSDSLLVLKDEWGDYNLYLWNIPAPGDWTYWDAVARNPSPLARDLWMIPSSNDALLITGINRGSAFEELGVFVDVGGDHDLYNWDNGGDQNFYLWNAPRPGDWTYWDAAARNPSPLARDLWIIPSNNNIFAISAPRLGAAPPTPTP